MNEFVLSDTRLIERWLPIAALGEESARERRSMTALPPTYYLHVWWARRPLVASRAALLASVLPADADRDRFMHMLGIHGDPVGARIRINKARQLGKRFKGQAYPYRRAFTYVPTDSDAHWVFENLGVELSDISALDPTAGGGSIPFEARRLGMSTLANDLNPVSALIMDATINWPLKYGDAVVQEYSNLANRFVQAREVHLAPLFPSEALEDTIATNYLWARTVICPYCSGLVPLSPNWRLNSSGIGIRLRPHLGSGPGSMDRVCAFEVVNNETDQSAGTVKRGVGTCPFPDCQRVISGNIIKSQAQAGGMGEQLYAVITKTRIRVTLKSGRRGKDKWKRGFRAPCPEDDNSAAVSAMLDQKLPEWEVRDIVPSERFPSDGNDLRPITYGMPLWRDLFSPRQLLCHGTSVEVYREMLSADRARGTLSELQEAAYGYLALALDKLCYFNSRMCVWNSYRSVIGNTFARHDYSFKWSYVEMAPLVAGIGYDWAVRQTAKCIRELVALIRPSSNGSPTSGMFESEADESSRLTPVIVSCKSGDNLDHVADSSIDVIVMDPPYYDNVMYAELSDFFYVWLKRTAGYVYPLLFRRHLTDKDSEAVANPARFAGQKGARKLASQDYRERMASIFAECHRTLKADGIMTVMFTHKASGAWDALTQALMEAGFTITASWPINTEAASSLHIRDKAAARSTIFLVCRLRKAQQDARGYYWEDVEPRVSQAVRDRISDFREAGIAGVDLYLASFGPALGEFSRHWPLRRGTPKSLPHGDKSADADPYATTPDDALQAARREVKRWRMDQLLTLKGKEELDSPTAFYVLAWDTFRAPKFSYDEALLLAHAVGANLDRDVKGRTAIKQGSYLVLLDSSQRARRGTLGPPDGKRGMIDAIHHAANVARTTSLSDAKELLQKDVNLLEERGFQVALQAVLEVLPPSAKFTGIDLKGALKSAGTDFETLLDLARLYLPEVIRRPKQLRMFDEVT